MKNLLFVFAFLFIGFSASAVHHDAHLRSHGKRVVVIKKVPTRVWVDGHYVWNAKRRTHRWVAGHYVKVKNRRAYIPAHYKKVRGRYVYVEARWVKV